MALSLAEPDSFYLCRALWLVYSVMLPLYTYKYICIYSESRNADCVSRKDSNIYSVIDEIQEREARPRTSRELVVNHIAARARVYSITSG